MKTVLVPVDFSEHSISAFRFALDIAARAQGAVHLLHVVTPPGVQGVAAFKQSSLKELKKVAEKKHARLLAAFDTDKVKIRTSVTEGRIHTAILSYLKRVDVDLVVMGTRGATGVREWVVGSNTEKMVRTSPVPVIAVKSYNADPVRNIVFPNALDTENQEELIMKVKALQHFFNATLHIIWINTPALTEPEPETRQRMKAFAERFMLKDYTINIFNYTDEEAGILEFTKQINGDMIAMGTHGLTGLAHLIAGSVAEDVVNHVQYPVWTFCTKSAHAFQTQKNSR